MKATVWIRTGRAARIMGLSRTQFKVYFIGRVNCCQTPGGHWQWDLAEIMQLASDKRKTVGTAGTDAKDIA